MLNLLQILSYFQSLIENPAMDLKHKPALFFIFWLLLGILQAYFVDLTSDEGYYWFYSRHLQWGYYDHPPMVALIIKLGYAIFHNELGVRLLNILLTSASFLLFFRLIPEDLKQKNITYLILLAQPLLHYFSIIVFPDGVLLFFSLLFLLGYKRLIEKDDASAALLLGLSLAGMFYSKYHGALVLVFTVLSNFRLFKTKWFWVSLLIPVILSIPHVLWQYESGFPSLQYHLSDRVSGLSLKHTGEYLSQQLVAISPVFLIALFDYKKTNQFEKTLKFIAIGTLCFFLFTSVKVFIHLHWTSIALFPMAFLAIKYYNDNAKRKLFYWLATPFFIVIILFRVNTFYPFLSFLQKIDFYQGRDIWSKEINSLAANKPVLFIRDFREPSFYTFYTGQMAVCIFGEDNRKTQYDLWNYEDSLQGKDILMIRKREFEGSNKFESKMGKTVYYQLRPHFESYYNIPVSIELSASANDSMQLFVRIKNERKTALSFLNASSGSQPVMFCQIKDNKNQIERTDTLKTFSVKDKIEPGKSAAHKFSISIKELKAGKYKMAFGFFYDVLPPSFNSINNSFVINKP